MGKSITLYIEDHEEVIAQLEEYSVIREKLIKLTIQDSNGIYNEGLSREEVERMEEIMLNLAASTIHDILYQLKEG